MTNRCLYYYVKAVFLNHESADSFGSAEGFGWVRKHQGKHVCCNALKQ